MKRLFALLPLLFALPAAAQSTYFINGDGTDVIIILCVPALNGESCLHLDEDVANLAIEVTGSDGVSDALYDIGTEIEDVAAPGTGAHTDPTANNVRVSPTGRANDTTEFQFADTVFDGTEVKTLCVTDNETTIAEWCWQILWVADSTDNQADVDAALVARGFDHWFDQAMVGTDCTDNALCALLVSKSATADFDSYDNETDSYEAIRDLLSSHDAALTAAQTDLDSLTRNLWQVDTTIATLATQVSFTLTAGSADDDAYNGCMAMITDQVTATQIAFAGIENYTGATLTVTLDADPGVFTMAASDLITITCQAVTTEFLNKSEVLGVGSSGDKWRGN